MSFDISGLSVTYQTSTASITALAPTDLRIGENEVITLIGPSGCGKSTLLHAIGGMLKASAGSVAFEGAPFAEPDPSKAAFVFQDYSLLPWRSVIQNVAIGLRFAHVAKAERRDRATRMLELVGLHSFCDAYPHELSGGMQQRVAVARAMVMDPKVLLMDEPFGALDEITRRQLGIEMSRIVTEQGKAVVMVTHSLDEAIFWADRILVMSPRPGAIVAELKVDIPRPRDLDFIATPEFAELRTSLFELLSDQMAEAGAGDRGEDLQDVS